MLLLPSYLAQITEHIDVSLAQETIEHLKKVDLFEWLSDHFVEILLVAFTWWLAKSTKELAEQTKNLAIATVQIESNSDKKQREGALRGIQVDLDRCISRFDELMHDGKYERPDTLFDAVDTLRGRVENNAVLMALDVHEYSAIVLFLSNVGSIRQDYEDKYNQYLESRNYIDSYDESRDPENYLTEHEIVHNLAIKFMKNQVEDMFESMKGVIDILQISELNTKYRAVFSAFGTSKNR